MPDAPRDAGTVPSRGDALGAATAVAVTVRVGEVVAGYAIDALAGAGGMGVVYRATEVENGRAVALKLIAPERAGDPALRELFVRESLTATRLEHPNVLPIYRAGEDDGRLFIAMRFVEGQSLHELIAASPGGVPPGRAARILARVADALDAAHARGLVHRDVKPANILIADPDGEEHVYLTDFGLSVPNRPRTAPPAGGWTGTLSYLAPEQIDGGPLDARTDVYALGCVLFDALTGRPPFPGDEEAVLEAHRSQDPPAPSALVPGLPPAMDAVVRRAMAKRPEDRFASAGELGRAALSARYDAALLACASDREAAQTIADGLSEAGLHPLVVTDGGPEAAEGVRASGACAVVVGREGLGDWARSGLSAARELAVRDRAFRLALILLPGAPDPADPALAYLATHPWIDLRAGLTDALATTDLVRALRGADVPAGLPSESGECPYRGLEAFREEDAALYFGREQDTAQLIERLRSTRFVAVLGPSGSGKSSLVRAGLLPAVRRGAIPGGEAWGVVEVVPGEQPLGALAAGLGQLPGAGAPSPADLAADERALDLAVARALDGRPGGERVMVLVDQLEEAFTLCADAGERAAFLGNLVYAATIPGGRVVVVAAMRADFYHRLAEHPELRALVSTHQHLVGPMDARALRRAIEEPARHAGLELEPGLTRRILTDVSDRPGTLPLLEHLLVELWQRRRGRTLTLEAYAASGGVEGALARRANAVYGAMPPERRAVARRVLLRLTQPGEGTEDTRRRALRSELVTRPEDDPEVEAVLASLTEARLVTAGRDPASGEPVVEVTHEALIRGWPELRGWLDEDRDRLRAERRLSDAAAEWDRGGREDGALYRGARLLAWQEGDRSALNPAEREFLAASDALAERERVTRRRRTRIALVALAAVAVVVTALGTVALVQRNNATDQEDLARSRELAANARLQLTPDPELSVLLAREAREVAETPQADEALHQAVAESRVTASMREGQEVVDALFTSDDRAVAVAGKDGTLRIWAPGAGLSTVRAGQGELTALAVSRDGNSIATAGADGSLRLWTGSGAAKALLRAEGSPVRSLDFDPSGRDLAASDESGQVRIWTPPRKTSTLVRTHAAGAWAVAFSPDGRLIASGSDDGLVIVSGRDGGDSRTFRGHTSVLFDVAFSPDGARLVSGAGDFTARVWRVDDPAADATVLRATAIGAVRQAEFAPDGAHIATAGSDGTVRVYASDGAPVTTLRGHQGQVVSAHWSGDGRRLGSAGDDGSVRVWDWSRGLVQAETIGPKDFPQDGGAQFSADGRSIWSVGAEGSLSTWDVRGGPLREVVPGAAPDLYLSSATVSPDGSLFATAKQEGVVTVRRTDGRGTPIRLPHPSVVSFMDIADDDSRIVTADAAGTVRLWNLQTREPTILVDEGPPLRAPDISPDGTLVAVGREDGVVQVWRTDTRALVASLAGHDGRAQDVVISPDDTTIASAGEDRTVRLWDLESGESRVLRGHGGPVRSVVFSRDGSRLASASDDGVRVWDVEGGFAALTIPSEASDTYRADLSPDASRVAVQTYGAHIKVFACTTCGPAPHVLALADRRVTRELSPAERDTFGLPSGT